MTRAEVREDQMETPIGFVLLCGTSVAVYRTTMISRLAEFCRVLKTGVYEDPAGDVAGVLAKLASQLRKVQRAIQAFCRREKITKLYAPGTWIYPRPACSI